MEWVTARAIKLLLTALARLRQEKISLLPRATIRNEADNAHIEVPPPRRHAEIWQETSELTEANRKRRSSDLVFKWQRKKDLNSQQI